MLQIRGKSLSGYLVLLTCPKEKVVVTSVCCFFHNEMTYALNNNDWLYNGFWCENPSSLEAMVNLTYTNYAKRFKRDAAPRNFQNTSGESLEPCFSNPFVVELFASIFHLFEAGIANTIFSYKLQKLFIFMEKIDILNYCIN